MFNNMLGSFFGDFSTITDFTKRHPDIPAPTYARPGDAGIDLQADLEEPVTLLPGEQKLIMTGISMAIPGSYVGLVCPRSGLAAKHGVTVLNAPGIIDSQFRGIIGVILINHSKQPYVVEPKDKIAQLVIMPFSPTILKESDSLDSTERNSGGFGSSGR